MNRPAKRILALALMLPPAASARALAQTPPAVDAPLAVPPATTAEAPPPPPSELVPLPAPVPAPEGTTAAASAEADAEAAKYAADLMSQAGMTGGETKTFSPSLRFYGFADFTVSKYVFLSDDWKGTINDKLSFGVSHINLYSEGDIAPDWKSMVEVRFLFQPDGSTPPGTNASVVDPLAGSGRINSTVGDVYDSNRGVALGGIAIQRAYIEYSVSPYLKVRAGHFLTPWGIWNVDHGSPVIIGPAKPYIIGEQFFPESQTGFEALGTVPVGDATLGYHLTLSNGRGPSQVLEDLDSNKAIGGRLFVRGYWLGQLDIGVSGYGGTVTDRRQQITDLTKQRLGWFDYSRYNEVSWAADLRWLFKGLHFQNEVALHDRAWSDDARPPAPQGAQGSQADVRRFGFYSLLAYRLPWLNLMPYAIFSYYDAGLRSAFGGSQKILAMSGGLNVRLTPTVVFKTELGVGKFIDATPGTRPASGPVNLWQSQIAWAF